MAEDDEVFSPEFMELYNQSQKIRTVPDINTSLLELRSIFTDSTALLIQQDDAHTVLDRIFSALIDLEGGCDDAQWAALVQRLVKTVGPSVDLAPFIHAIQDKSHYCAIVQTLMHIEPRNLYVTYNAAHAIRTHMCTELATGLASDTREYYMRQYIELMKDVYYPIGVANEYLCGETLRALLAIEGAFPPRYRVNIPRGKISAVCELRHKLRGCTFYHKILYDRVCAIIAAAVKGEIGDYEMDVDPTEYAAKLADSGGEGTSCVPLLESYLDSSDQILQVD